MSQVRLLVGTKKGAFVITADGTRKDWSITGPHFAGWEMYHLKGSPVDPNRIYASQSSGWFGQVMQRSDDGGATWSAVGNKFQYDGEAGTHQWYDGTPHPWEFKRVWHLEPSLTCADTVYAGAEDAALFVSKDGGASWAEMAGLRKHGSGPAWQPGRAACACTLSCWTLQMRSGSSLPSLRRGRFAPMTGESRGSRSTAACTRCIFPIRRRRWGIACIMWRCTRHGLERCSCRSTGT